MSTHFFKQVQNSIKHWYLTLIVGIILILTGFWTFTSPVESYLTLSILFSVSFLISGLLEVSFAISNRKQIDGWGWSLVLGMLTTIFGFILISRPEISFATLPLYVGFIVMFRSIGAIGTALDLKNYGIMNWGTLMVLGVLGVIFSFMLIWNPIFAGLTVIIWTGLAFLFAGISSIYLAFKLRKLHKLVK